MKTILVVDDEPKITQLVRDYLERAGFGVLIAHDGRKALSLAKTEKPEAVILDLGLPQLDGLDFTREFRKTSNAPIIMLTARSEESDKLIGLELGADDYVTKPFSPMELRARIKAALRRGTPDLQQPHRFGDYEVDMSRFELRHGGKPVDLTPIEFKLLAAFVQNKRSVLTRQQLLDHVWGRDIFVTDRVVDTHVSNLRRKIEADPENPVFLVSIRGVGYRFEG